MQSPNLVAKTCVLSIVVFLMFVFLAQYLGAWAEHPNFVGMKAVKEKVHTLSVYN